MKHYAGSILVLYLKIDQARFQEKRFSLDAIIAKTAQKQKAIPLQMHQTIFLISRPGWYFPRKPTNFVCRKFLKSQEILGNMSQILSNK